MHTTDEDAGGEDGGVAGGFDDVAGTNFGIAGHVVDVGAACAAAVPEQIAEVAAAAHAAGDARLAVGDGKYERVVLADEIDDADYAPAANYTHFGADAVGASAVDDEVAVAAGADVVAHHAGGEEAEAVETTEYAAFGVGAVVLGFGEGVAQPGVLTLQADVVVGEDAVDVAEVEKTLGLAVRAVELGGAFTGGGEPHAALIVVEAEKEGETHDFEHDEQEDVVVATEKIEKNLHGVGRFSGAFGVGRGSCSLPVGAWSAQLCGLRCAAGAFEMLSGGYGALLRALDMLLCGLRCAAGAFEMLSGVLWCAVDGLGPAAVQVAVCRGDFGITAEAVTVCSLGFWACCCREGAGQRSLWVESTSAPPERSDGAPV